MRSLASFILVLLIMVMSPELREAFGEVAGALIISGTVDLQETEQFLDCIGERNGVRYQITSRWVGGAPAWIKFEMVETEL
jgi:hypothetical protein